MAAEIARDRRPVATCREAACGIKTRRLSIESLVGSIDSLPAKIGGYTLAGGGGGSLGATAGKFGRAGPWGTPPPGIYPEPQLGGRRSGLVQYVSPTAGLGQDRNLPTPSPAYRGFPQSEVSDRCRHRPRISLCVACGPSSNGFAAAWPLAGHAQQPERVRRVGVLIGFPENDPFAQRIVSAFAQALGRFGWVEGKNIRIDYRFAAGDPALYKTYAAELVGLMPDAILASPRRRSRHCGSRRARYRSFSYSCPIPSGWALFRASRDPAATSPGSAPTTRR